MKTYFPLKLGLVVAGLLPAVVAVLLCIGGSDPSQISVAGTVIADGKPLSRGSIRFVSDSLDQPAADVAPITDGVYSIPSSERLVPGTYMVQILGPGQDSTAMFGQTDGGAHPDSSEWIPSQYNTSSVIRVEIARGRSYHFDFDLKL
jgi:hypothetical protein